MVNLDYQSRVPIYEQIVNSIEKYVVLGILKEKQQIPSIREMATTIGVNPNTVKKSYDILESKGIIQTISTKGTFITDNIKKASEESIKKKIDEIKALVAELQKMGLSMEKIMELIKK